MALNIDFGQIPIYVLHQCGVTSLLLKLTFWLENDGEKWSRIFYSKIWAPLEIPANLSGQFSLSGQIVLHWAVATLKGLGEFQNEKKSRPFSWSFLSQKR